MCLSLYGDSLSGWRTQAVNMSRSGGKSSDKSAPLLADDDNDSTGLIASAAANVQDTPAAAAAPTNSKTKSLVISFVLMVVIGLGNKIFQVRAAPTASPVSCHVYGMLVPVSGIQVLEFIPMNNYPLFINLLTTLVYIPARYALHAACSGHALACRIENMSYSIVWFVHWAVLRAPSLSFAVVDVVAVCPV